MRIGNNFFVHLVPVATICPPPSNQGGQLLLCFLGTSVQLEGIINIHLQHILGGTISFQLCIFVTSCSILLHELCCTRTNIKCHPSLYLVIDDIFDVIFLYSVDQEVSCETWCMTPQETQNVPIHHWQCMAPIETQNVPICQ